MQRLLNTVCFSKISNASLVRLKSKSAKLGHKKKQNKRYSDTLNLPKTSFPLSLRNGAALQRELSIKESLSFKTLYAWQKSQKHWEKEFVLHDGPPYANGKTHIGHFLNKVLKDITNRYKVLTQHRVEYVPGWDCHGMPIEMKALSDDNKNLIQLSSLELRAKARQFSLKTIEDQKSGFKLWGVMGDWDNCYTTLDPSYQSKELDVFYDIYQKGYIYRDYMPVYWSTSSRTALAESELEYNPDHVSTSVYVTFPLVTLSPQLQNIFGCEKKLNAVVWTTTPWTLPFNEAICFDQSIEYCFLKEKKSQNVYICEDKFREELFGLLGGNVEILTKLEGSVLHSCMYKHPFKDGQELPFLVSRHVVSGKGTGLIHTAPAHGPEDFRIGIKYNLPKECHVDETGKYISGVPEFLLGKVVGQDADQAVLQGLGDHVLKTEEYTHRYPYDWRTKQPVILRASKQWFIDTVAIQDQALEQLKEIDIIPPSSEIGMVSQLISRLYWCISRQRKWGLPMPVFYHKQTGDHFITRESVDHVKRLILEKGADCWWQLPVSELLPDHIVQKTENGSSDDYVKGEDIFDIWFDSGVSWASVLKDGVADLYLEGHDQFKGWFQTSLLTSVAVTGKPPYKKLVTHSFATDENKRKMSKSEGNVVDPETVIYGGKGDDKTPAYGIDVLRWWVAQNHNNQHIMLGPTLLDNLQDNVFKVRKSIRFLLGNLSDFDKESHLVDYSNLTIVDKYMLYIVYHTFTGIQESYENCEYHEAIRQFEHFLVTDLSAFYITHIKDRCYCESPGSAGRRSSQTVQYYISDIMTRAFAPVLPHLAEEVYSYLPSVDSEHFDSIFKVGWYKLEPEWSENRSFNEMFPLLDMNKTVMNELNGETPGEFHLHIYSSPHLHQLLTSIQTEHTSSQSPLTEIFQTSWVTILDSPPPVIPEDMALLTGTTSVCINHEQEEWEDVDYKILVGPAMQQMCERCRRYTAETTGTPCQRCMEVMADDWAS